MKKLFKITRTVTLTTMIYAETKTKAIMWASAMGNNEFNTGSSKHEAKEIIDEKV